VFWGSGSQPAWRVLLALEIKKLPYESRQISFSDGDHKTPEFLAMNPRHKVPTIRSGDYVLYESLAILAYLDARSPEPPLFGTSPEETGLVWRWVMEFGNYLEPPVHERIVRPLFFNRAASEGDGIREAIPKMHAELPRWEAALGQSPWLVGDRISAADVVLFPTVMALLRAAAKPDAAAFDLGVLPLEQRYPNLAAWVKRIEAIPGYERTYPPHWRA